MFFSKGMKLGDKEIIFESGKMARQANGAVIIRYGDENVVLVTACAKREAAAGFDYFPLMVEYREKFYASGKIPGGFIKREARQSDHEKLSGRVIDRPIRPMFPEGFKNEVQIICNVLSSDGKTYMDTTGVIGASLALNLSDIPFTCPVAGVRVGRLEGEFVLNPSVKDMDRCDIELVLCGGKGFVSMVEGESSEVSEDEMLAAVEFGQKAIDDLCDLQEEIIKEYGKEKFTFSVPEVDKDLEKKVIELSKEKLTEISQIKLKQVRNDARKELYTTVFDALTEEYPDDKSTIGNVLHDLEKDIIRKRTVNEQIRIDGRGPKDIRQITCDLDILPKAHGSALFTRGETQSLGVVTLGKTKDSQLDDSIYGDDNHKFYLHYNFPGFSVGEVKRQFSVSNREIGHGHLAQRSFYPVLPDMATYPYTIRLVSEILESNGSSSMATVCSNSMAMMAAGIEIKEAVAGIAMGLIKEGDDVVILSDILGDEDHLGDMDFKVTGTKNGICAYQMDIKLQGISIEIMKAALIQAKEAREHILGIMNEAISEPRAAVAKHAPQIQTFKIEPDEVGKFIGPGGKNIKGVIEKFKVDVEVDDTGTIKIFSKDEESDTEGAFTFIELMFAKPIPGTIYDATVKSIKDFGAFVEILPGKEGLVHISEVAIERVTNIDDFLKLGQVIKVKYVGSDKQGRIKLVRKELLLAEKKED